MVHRKRGHLSVATQMRGVPLILGYYFSFSLSGCRVRMGVGMGDGQVSHSSDLLPPL